MTKTYVIQWQSRTNGRSGRGTREFSRPEAEQLAEELNRQYPDIDHEVVDAESVPKFSPVPLEPEPLEDQT